jgi:hypothetical protein
MSKCWSGGSVKTISGVKLNLKVSMLALSVVVHGFELRLGQIRDYEIGICCFSTKHTSIMGKSSA